MPERKLEYPPWRQRYQLRLLSGAMKPQPMFASRDTVSFQSLQILNHLWALSLSTVSQNYTWKESDDSNSLLILRDRKQLLVNCYQRISFPLLRKLTSAIRTCFGGIISIYFKNINSWILIATPAGYCRNFCVQGVKFMPQVQGFWLRSEKVSFIKTRNTQCSEITALLFLFRVSFYQLGKLRLPPHTL